MVLVVRGRLAVAVGGRQVGCRMSVAVGCKR